MLPNLNQNPLEEDHVVRSQEGHHLDDENIIDLTLDEDDGGSGNPHEPPAEPVSRGSAEAIDKFPPRKGMKFDRLREVVEYYRLYAQEMGFPTRIESTEKRKEMPAYFANGLDDDYDHHATKIRLHCAKGGLHTPKGVNTDANNCSRKTGCLARLNANVGDDGKWKITHFVEKHNHDFEKDGVRFMPHYRGMTESDIRRVLNNDNAGISVAQTYASFAVEKEAWSNIPFRERDLRNALNRARRLFMEKGDFAALEKLFKELTRQCPDFYYAFNRTEEGVLRNVFWADGRCRAAYREFGDVISFDATYLKNRYKMPFTPFIGVNHHGQSTLLGCALVSNEDTETYEWLFTEYLKCMGGVAPKGILTDQCPAMGKAIENVMPDTSHRWCIWHVKENGNKAIGNHPQYEDLKKALDRAVYNTWTVELFEEAWAEMVTTFDISTNKWINKVYASRSKWAPVFFRHEFWAGMSSTQRSEGMNNYFRGYFNENTSLVQFGEQYNLAHAKRVEDEAEATHNSLDRPVQCKTIFPWEAQIQAVYTSKKFIEFQKQLCSVQYQVETLLDGEGVVREYIVSDSSHRVANIKKKGLSFNVTYNSATEEVSCICKKFEFRGILCKHALKVLQREEVLEIPERYILRRWRKDIPRCHTNFSVPIYGAINRRPQSRTLTNLLRMFESTADLILGDEELCEEFATLIETFKATAMTKRLPPRAARRIEYEIESETSEQGTATMQPNGTTGASSSKGNEHPVKDPPDRRTPGRTTKYRKGHWKRKPSQKSSSQPDKMTPNELQESKKNNKRKGNTQTSASPGKGTKTARTRVKKPTTTKDVGSTLCNLVKPKEKKKWLTM